MSSNFQKSLIRDFKIAKMSKYRKRTLDDRHEESVRRLAIEDENFAQLPRSRWSRYMWKKYNDMMGERFK